jgi:hypothetical protein
MLVPRLSLLLPRTGLALGRSLLLTVAPQGGQQVARRNAWAGMSDDGARARARREAEQAFVVLGKVPVPEAHMAAAGT